MLTDVLSQVDVFQELLPDREGAPCDANIRCALLADLVEVVGDVALDVRRRGRRTDGDHRPHRVDPQARRQRHRSPQ